MDLDNFSGPGAISAATFTGNDRFAPVRRLGAGGMGVVFEVFDRERDEHVALKTLRHVSAQGLYYLKREFRSLQGMHHPNLVRLLELIQSGGQWFFTMELIRGRDFLAHVRDEPTVQPAGKQRGQDAMADTQLASDDVALSSSVSISPLTGSRAGAAEATDYARLRTALHGILDGLGGLHAAGMVHRDIKPSNIMVTRRGRVVLLDFGLTGAMVKRKHLDGESQRMMGTPGYMSPEQYTSSDVTPASDLYSVGVTLYEALTGHLPYSGPVADIMEACKSPPTPPAKVVPAVPANLSELAMALLQYQPTQRPSLDQVRERLGTSDRARPRPRAVTPRPEADEDTDFVGRAEQLASLHELLDRVLAGHPVSVFVEGASGIGKTALAREFLRDVEQQRGAVVLMGRCYESESVPYKAFDSLIDDLRRYLASLGESTLQQLLPEHIGALKRLFPVLELRPYHPAPSVADADLRDLRARAFAALKQLLRRLSRHVDLVVFIDDLQWGDADSAALLRELLSPPDAPTMLFLATYRGDGDGDPLIDSVVREHRRIELSPLADDDSRELITRMAARQNLDVDRWSERILREGHGSPFFIGEMVRHLHSIPEPEQLDPEAPEGLLGDVVASRIARLPRQAARLLRAAAVIGRPVPPAFLCTVMEVALADGLRSIELLVAANMLRSDRNGDVGVYHDQLREAVVDQLPARKVRDTYKRVRAAIEKSGGDARRAELLGLDYMAETDPKRALAHAKRAAELAENAFAFDRAARLYALALELCPAAERRELMTRRADVLHLGGYGAAAAEVYLELAADAEPGERVELTRRAADDLLHAGRIDEGLDSLAEVAKQLGVKIGRSRARTIWGIAVNRARLAVRGLGYKPRSEAECEPTELARLDSLFAAATALGVVDHLNGTLLQTQHLLAALGVGEEHRVWRAIAAEVVFLSAQGGRAARRAAELHAQLTEHAEALDDDYLRASAHMGAGYLNLFSGRYAEAHERFDAANKMLLAYPDAWWERNLARYWDTLSLVTIGDFARVAKILPRLLRTAEERNDRYMLSSLRTHPMVLNCLRDDRPDDAEAQLDAALEMWTGDRQYVAHYTVMISRVAVRVYQQRPDEALQLLRDAKSLMRQLLVHRLPFINSEVDKLTAVSAIGIGDRKLALRNIRALEKLGHPMGAAYGAIYRAGFAFQDGDSAEALRLARLALPLFDDCGAQHDSAATRYRIGQLTPGPEGEAFKAKARAWLQSHGVVNRRRMIDYLTPGFTRSS